jgi:hypothetical protein
MNTKLTIGLLLCWVMLYNCCSKENRACVASISLQLNNAGEIEWKEVEGSRLDVNGELNIDAMGFSEERFQINLQNVSDTGMVPVSAIRQLHIADGIGFQSGQLQAGFIRIVEKTPYRLYAVFELFFTDNSLAPNLFKAKGSFQVLCDR